MAPAARSRGRHAAPAVFGRAWLSTAACFLACGCAYGTWASRLPAIKAGLGLDSAALGLALLWTPAGLIAATQATPYLVRGLTSAWTCRLGAAGLAVSLPAAALARNLPELAVALLAFGASFGCTDSAMNIQAAALNRGRRPVMAGLHGIYSAGALAGALGGSLAAGEHARPLANFLLAGAAVGALGLAATPGLLGRDADRSRPAVREPGQPRAGQRRARYRAVLLIGIIACCSLFAEGSADDWGAVFLREVRHASYSVAALAPAAASAGMMIGRLCGDPLIARAGRRLILALAPVTAVAGMALALLAPEAALTVAGYAILGLGTAVIVPVCYGWAGGLPGAEPAWAISKVTSLGYAGLMSGPVVIGLTASRIGLAGALVIPAALLALILPAGRIADRQTAAATFPAVTSPRSAPAPAGSLAPRPVHALPARRRGLARAATAARRRAPRPYW
jgi:predicted MFS family arabinose efflux permease